MTETLCQVYIGLLGAGAIGLMSLGTGRYRSLAKWGFVLGLASEPVWAYSASRAGQWGVVLLCAWWGACWGIGAYRCFNGTAT